MFSDARNLEISRGLFYIADGDAYFSGRYSDMALNSLAYLFPSRAGLNFIQLHTEYSLERYSIYLVSAGLDDEALTESEEI